MKLNLNFALYKGETLLRGWWKKVKEHFEAVQTAHNALEDTVAAEKTKLSTEIAQRTNAGLETNARINAEVTARTNADTALDGKITAERSDRLSADNALDGKITAERNARVSADSALDGKITAEQNNRAAADSVLSGRIAAAEEKAHIHNNKSVLDSISDLDIEKWNGISKQVTQSELNTVTAYLEEICFGLANELKNIYGAMGVTVYNGGLFGEEQNDIMLDGGGFNEEATAITDCGGFEPLRITTETGTVVDGGIF